MGEHQWRQTHYRRQPSTFIAASPLLQWGVSFLGAHQFATGQMLTNPEDRQAILSIMDKLMRFQHAHVQGDPDRPLLLGRLWNPSATGSGGNPDRPLVFQKLHNAARQSALLQWGVSFFGAQQFATGQVVTNPEERQAIVHMLDELMLHGPPVLPGEG